jgi:1-acyl-sn-glycerol-3-phosphate acyltransferase
MIRAVAQGSPTMASSSRRASPASGKVRDIFLARLGDLEERVERELGRAPAAVGPAGEFVFDFVREAWRAGAGLVEAASTAAGRRGFLAWLAAGAETDELGLDAAMAETVREIVRPLARRWLGVRASRSAALPEGGVLLLCNRSAWPLPVEALVLWAFLGDGRAGSRPMAVMWDADVPELPFVSDFLRRIGLVAATPENALALLERGAVVLAFPEGSSARAKTYDRRYRLTRFADASLLGAAMEAGAHIVPGAVVGSEESYPVLGHVGALPITAQFPLLGVLGLLPLPLSWSLRLGPAVEVGAPGAGAPGIDALADAVRGRMAALLGELLAERQSIVGG